MNSAYFSQFGIILLFILGGGLFISLVLLVAKIIRPDRPNEEKTTTYECGEEPSGSAWGKFNIRFYVVALIFILFDVEIVFLFPWATIFGQKQLSLATGGSWGWYAMIEMFIFVAILAFGLAYAWRKKLLDWEKPETATFEPHGNVPMEKYEQVNKKYNDVKTREVKRN